MPTETPVRPGLDDTQLAELMGLPDLALDKAGVVVRARRIQGRMGDSVIKLRPLDPDQVVEFFSSELTPG